jgi:hypothetical protein
MHAAAMGRVCGPRLGVVEDVAALRAALLGILAITDRKHVAWEAAHAALGDEPRCIHESWDMTPSPGVTAMHARCFRCGMVWNGEWRQPTQPEGEP